MNGARPSVRCGQSACALVRALAGAPALALLLVPCLLALGACGRAGTPAADGVAAGGSGAGGALASGGAQSPSSGGAGTGGLTGSGGASGASTGGASAGGTVGNGGALGTGGQASGGAGSGGGTPVGPVTLPLMESVVFFDGYADTSDEPVPEGVLRLDNSLFTTRLTSQQLSQIQPHLVLDVTIGALCDNYDRIGSVRLALVPKGATTYDPANTPHLELARFITPFMDKNAQPDTVPYSWQVDHVAAILRSTALNAEYDFWLELSVFGVPYAANEEVAGCSGRSDVFRGWVSLTTDSTVPDRQLDVLLPVAFDERFNDYQAGASDAIGDTKKTLEISLDSDLEDAELVFVISHHGANSGGEEYERREHFVSLDGQPVLEFTPGRTTCEPFRQFNTQSNGIYGLTPRSDADWQSFSNWCPGDVIDIRRIPWPQASAGLHEFVMDVPDAVFNGDEGNFPLSVFVLGRAAP